MKKFKEFVVSGKEIEVYGFPKRIHFLIQIEMIFVNPATGSLNVTATVSYRLIEPEAFTFIPRNSMGSGSSSFSFSSSPQDGDAW